MEFKDLIFNLFASIYKNQFKYENLPNEIPPEFIEQQIFLNGAVVYGERGTTKIIGLPTLSGELNWYGKWYQCNIRATNGKSLPAKYYIENVDENCNIINQNAVIIKDNYDGVPPVSQLRTLTDRLASIWKTIGIVEVASRIKIILKGDNQLVKQLQSKIDALVDNEKCYITLGEKGSNVVLSENQNTIGDISNSQSFSDFWLDFDKTFMYVCMFCGINANPNQKAERMVADEVNSNNEFIAYVMEQRINCRQRAVDKINELFKLNIELIYKQIDTDNLLDINNNLIDENKESV